MMKSDGVRLRFGSAHLAGSLTEIKLLRFN